MRQKVGRPCVGQIAGAEHVFLCFALQARTRPTGPDVRAQGLDTATGLPVLWISCSISLLP